MNSRDIQLDLLSKLELNPSYTQRELSRDIGVSLGKVNYCMQKLMERGLVKLNNFSLNNNKVGYAYLHTPKGVDEKARLTIAFLKAKITEYEDLKDEINKLKNDPDKLHSKLS